MFNPWSFHNETMAGTLRMWLAGPNTRLGEGIMPRPDFPAITENFNQGSGRFGRKILRKVKDRGTQFPGFSPEKCSSLYTQIQDLLGELDRRAEDLRTDPHDLVPRGHMFENNPLFDEGGGRIGTVEGHERKYREKQKELDSARAEYESGCKGGPPLPPGLPERIQEAPPHRTRPIPPTFLQRLLTWPHIIS
jgi:hypothetical protein